MVDIVISVSTDDIEKRLGNLASQSGAVIARAANRSIVTGKKAIKQETAKVYNVRQKDVEVICSIRKATRSHPVVYFTYKDKHKNLYWFGKTSSLRPRHVVRSSSPYNPDPEFVRARVKNGQDIRLEERPKPFVQRAAGSGNIALFQRISDKSDAPIQGIAAPALPQIIKNDRVMARFTQDTYSMFHKRLEHEISNVLKGVTK